MRWRRHQSGARGLRATRPLRYTAGSAGASTNLRGSGDVRKIEVVVYGT